MRKIFFSCLWLLSTAAFSQDTLIHPGQITFVTINGAKYFVEMEGRGDPVVLIAGGPGNSHDYFHPAFSALADSFRVIYFDAYGRGLSDRAKNRKEYTFDRDVNDLDSLRQKLGFKKWTVIGHSYGGMVAQAYAIRYPQYTQRVVLLNTFDSGEMWQANCDSYNHEMKTLFPEQWHRVDSLRKEGFVSSDSLHIKAYSGPSAFAYYYDPSNVPAFKWWKDYMMNLEVYYHMVGRDGDFQVSGELIDLDFRKELKNIKAPVLICAGRYDRVSTPEFAIRYKQSMPGARFVMFEYSGHNPYIEENSKFFRVLREFLRQ